MPPLTVGGVTIPIAVRSGGRTRDDNVDRGRRFDNSYSASQTGGAARDWHFTTPPIARATADAYEAQLAIVTPQVCGGDIIGAPTMCCTEIDNPWTPTKYTASSHLVELSFTVHEVQPAYALLRYTPGDTISSETFTRSTVGTYNDLNLNVKSAAINAKRDAHYTGNGAARSTLLESSGTNLLIRAEEFDNAVWSKTNITLTANNITCPDGVNVAADKIQATAAASTQIFQSATVAATVCTYSVYIKQGSGATDGNCFAIRNATTATNLLSITFNYSTQAIAYVVGSTGASVEALGNGWFRLIMTVGAGITSGNSISVYCGFVGNTETATEYMYAWGAQLEAQYFATSYISTTSAQVTRGADSYQIPYTTPPQEMTVYAKFTEKGSLVTTSATIFGIENAGGAAPALGAFSTGTVYRGSHNNNVATVQSDLAVAPVAGNVVELSVRLFGDGSVDISQSINGGAVTSGTQSGANALAAAWSGLLAWLNSGGTSNTGYTAYQSFKIVAGVRSLVEMRSL